MNDKQKVFMNSIHEMRDYSVKSMMRDLDSDAKNHNFDESIVKYIKKLIIKTIDVSTHSYLVMIDNGTLLADHYPIEVIDAETKESISNNIAFHEYFDMYDDKEKVR